MKYTHRFKKFCTEFVVLDDVEKDYVLGISKALAFAVKKPKCTRGSAMSSPEKITRPLPHIDGVSEM